MLDAIKVGYTIPLMRELQGISIRYIGHQVKQKAGTRIWPLDSRRQPPKVDTLPTLVVQGLGSDFQVTGKLQWHTGQHGFYGSLSSNGLLGSNRRSMEDSHGHLKVRARSTTMTTTRERASFRVISAESLRQQLFPPLTWKKY